MIVDERSTPPEAQDNPENANAGFEPSQDPPNEDNDNPASPEHHDIDRPTAQGDSNSPPLPPHNPNTPENNHAGGPSWGRIGAMAIGGTMCIAPMLVAAPVLGLVGFGAAGPIAGALYIPGISFVASTHIYRLFQDPSPRAGKPHLGRVLQVAFSLLFKAQRWVDTV